VKEFRIRCSALGEIMADPTAAAMKAGEVLSVGAKTFIRKMAREDIFGVTQQITSKQMDKGIQCEQAAIELYNAAFFTSHAKNTERRTDDYITGECDIAADPIIDIKCSWSVASFPICELDGKDSGYEWQGRGYMRLWNVDRFRLAYCLVDTPDDLIGFEQPELHKVSHIDDNLRVTVIDFARDIEKEARIVEKVKAAQEYYAQVIAEFDRTHK
jgi:hypothetical protein